MKVLQRCCIVGAALLVFAGCDYSKTPTEEPAPVPTSIEFEAELTAEREGYLALVRGEADGVVGLATADNMTDAELLAIGDKACEIHLADRSKPAEQLGAELLELWPSDLINDAGADESSYYALAAGGSGMCYR